MKVSEHPSRLPPALRQQAEAQLDVPEAPEPPPVYADDTAVPQTPEMLAQPLPLWEPIESAPLNGRDVVVRWGEDDEGRTVCWKAGRFFDGRRWISGGRWVPSDSMQPCPANPPSHWLHEPAEDDSEPAAADEDAETVAA